MDRARLRDIIRNFPENGMKRLLEDPRNIHDLLALTGRNLENDIDLEQPGSVKETFIKGSYRHTAADVVIRAPLVVGRDETRNLWIYILIEHQSRPDVTMPLRLLEYVLEVYKFQEREWKRGRGAHARFYLEPVLPVVFYTGTRQWDEVGTLVDLVIPCGRFRNEIPLLHPLFLNLPAMEPGILEGEGGFFGWVLRLVQARKSRPGLFRRLLVRIIRHLESMPEADRFRWETFLEYIHALVYHERHPAEQSRLHREIEASVDSDTHRREVCRMGKTIAEDLVEKGHARGQLETARATLIRQLRVKFGEISQKSVEIIQATSDLERLNNWLDLVVTADSLEDVGIGS